MSLSSLIVERGIATIRQVEEALSRQVIYGGDLATNLLEVATVDEAALTALLADALGLRPAAIGPLPLPSERARTLMPGETAARLGIAPLNVEGDRLVVAVADALPDDVRNELAFALGLRIEPVAAPGARIRQSLDRTYGLALERRLKKLLARLDQALPPSPPETARDTQPLSPVPAPVAPVAQVAVAASVEDVAIERAPVTEPMRNSAIAAVVQPSQDSQPLARMELTKIAAPPPLPPPPTEPTQPVVDAAPPPAPPSQPPPVPPAPPSLQDLAASIDMPSAPATSAGAVVLAPAVVAPAVDLVRATVPQAVPAAFAPTVGVAVPPAPPAPPPPAPSAPASTTSVERPSGSLGAGPVSRETASGRTLVARPWRRRRGPLTLDRAKVEVEEAVDRDALLDLFFDFAKQYFEYSALFIALSDHADGRDANGPGASRERVIGMSIPLDVASMFATAREQRAYLITHASTVGVDPVLLSDLQRVPGGSVFVVPLLVKNRCVALFYADDGDSGVEPVAVSDVAAFAQLVGRAFEKLIVRKKMASALASQSSPSLPTGAGEPTSPAEPAEGAATRGERVEARRSTPAPPSVVVRRPAGPPIPREDPEEVLDERGHLGRYHSSEPAADVEFVPPTCRSSVPPRPEE